MVWTAPYGIVLCQNQVVANLNKGAVREPDYPNWNGYVEALFQLHGVDAAEQVVLRRKLRRSQVLAFLAKLPPTAIGMEACGAAHYWARELGTGHKVKLIAPQHVKAYVKRNKNDGRDAEGLCEAMSRPTRQLAPMKTEEQQAALMLAGMRERLVTRRTQLSNAIRGYAAEFGLTVTKGIDKIEPLLADIATNQTLPTLTRDLFAMHGQGVCATAGRAEEPSRPGCWPGTAPMPTADALHRSRGLGRSSPQRWS